MITHKLDYDAGPDSVVSWLTDDELARIYTSDYWNDIEQEKKKEWWIADGQYDRCLAYLRSSGLMAEYRAAEEEISGLRRDLVVADLGAGIGWASALLSKIETVKAIHAVEISRHRIGQLCDEAIKMFGGDGSKIRRYVGSFYETKLPTGSVDVVFLSQAFHHANNPFKLLTECHRLLKPDGTILIVGEPYVGMARLIRRFLSELIRRRRLRTYFYELFQPDPVLGDHYYRVSDYQFMFMACGLAGRLKRLASGNVMYVVKRCAGHLV